MEDIKEIVKCIEGSGSLIKCASKSKLVLEQLEQEQWLQLAEDEDRIFNTASFFD